ncbi:MAG: DUF354 domain-containing protein [Flavobacteriales bacterium]
MRILIDINHPAHVHLFRNFAGEMMKQGHDVFFTTRRKEISHLLLERYDLPYKVLGAHYKSMLGKLWGIIKYDFLLALVALKFKPDLFLSMGSIYNSHVAFLFRKPNILLQDTENATLQNKLSFPFSDLILNPKCYKLNLGKKQFKYDGYHELAYLHPNRFTPDLSVLETLGVKQGERFIIMRFVSWNANHDVNHSGLTDQSKVKAVKTCEKYGKVFVTSEGELPEEIKKNQIKIPIEKIHHAMAYASLLYGESATMASESAVLGVPAIFLDNDGRGYTDEQQTEFGLVFNFTESLADQQKSIEVAEEILATTNAENWKLKRDNMLKDRIDLTAFLVWLVNGYPETKEELFVNGQLQRKFKNS